MDFQIANFINHFWQWSPLLWTGHARVDAFSQIISRRRSMAIIRAVTISLALFFKKKYRKFVLLSFIFAAGLFYLVAEVGGKSILVHEIGIRPRPYVAHVEIITPIGKKYSDSSFPSSHVTLTVALITVLILLFPAVRPYAILYALLMAWSRIHNGMHYPSDVLVGAMLGIWCGRSAIVLSRRVFMHN